MRPPPYASPARDDPVDGVPVLARHRGWLGDPIGALSATHGAGRASARSQA